MSGAVGVGLSEPCMGPYTTSDSGSTGRRLVDLSSINVTRDVFDIRYRLKNAEVDPTDIKFDV